METKNIALVIAVTGVAGYLIWKYLHPTPPTPPTPPTRGVEITNIKII